MALFNYYVVFKFLLAESEAARPHARHRSAELLSQPPAPQADARQKHGCVLLPSDHSSTKHSFKDNSLSRKPHTKTANCLVEAAMRPKRRAQHLRANQPRALLRTRHPRAEALKPKRLLPALSAANTHRTVPADSKQQPQELPAAARRHRRPLERPRKRRNSCPGLENAHQRGRGA